jgi:hypothetical protein
MLLPSDPSCGALEHFIRDELGDEMAATPEGMPLEQFGELQHAIRESTRHHFQRRVRADVGGATLHRLRSEATDSEWLESALPYLPNRKAIHDPIANSALFFATFLRMNDTSFGERACQGMAGAPRANFEWE